MSLAIGAASSSESMGFDKSKGDRKEEKTTEGTRKLEEYAEACGKIGRQMSEGSIYATEDEDESDVEGNLELGPQFTLKEQLEKDKDDESLRKWKEQLLGSVDINSIGDPDVKILSLAIKSSGRPDIFLPIPESGNPKGLWFSLKEGSRYSLKFTFQVSNNIVSGLKYTNAVWKTGVKGTLPISLSVSLNFGFREILVLNCGLFPSYESLFTVDCSKQMLGTFSPQLEPYTHEMLEETTPSGFFARGSYSARTKFLDDDNKCYLEINYTFDIRTEWQ